MRAGEKLTAFLELESTVPFRRNVGQQQQHRGVQEQEATISQLKSTSTNQEATISQLKSTEAKQETVKQQASQIQKVSAQLEVSKSAPQTVLNSQ